MGPHAGTGAEKAPDGRVLDCLIAGGGPAGATAAIYLARFRRSVTVIDAQESRTRWIGTIRNYPGFPEGISGPDLCDRIRRQASKHGAVFVKGHVRALHRTSSGFEALTSEGMILARHVILATGLKDRLPDVPGFSEQLIMRDKVRLCPICDGHDFIGNRLAVWGEPSRALREAVFLRTFTNQISIVPDRPLTSEDSHSLASSGFDRVMDQVTRISEDGEGVSLHFQNGDRRDFDAIYLAMGAAPRSDLAVTLGAAANKAGCLKTDDHRQTNVPGLYSIGDVVDELDQISVATGHAAIAATSVHNAIARALGERPLTGRREKA
ncbi:NAD(P)/FAD-dependent oxidoreductase [Pseudaminobacter sp. 19-2017]|uniref:Thioredoxin reductase n=1 Tax=Pseudaminobacter soli (ex Zhang et al. 2022) TaxID=2831468 RepID=A0A942I3Q5_9HYPH|nr:NAD(P)/FAD-dependent oxidoreductase [Pseudaminobacter soli]